jgi:6-phosphogluconolactonase
VTGTWKPQVRVFPDMEAMSVGAAERFNTLAKETIVSRGRFIAALSGGSTPRRFYSLLGSPLYRDKIDWNKVHLFWADERCVPRGHSESNFKLVADTLLAQVALPAKNIHRIKGENKPELAAEEYEQNIRSFFGSQTTPEFDILFLGAGEDGHTASLFPGTVTLREMIRLAMPVYLDPPNLHRVTLTLPLLNQARRVLFLVSGQAKARMVYEIVENGNPHGYPAGLVHPAHGSIAWFVDKDAAGLLRKNYD